MKNNLKINIMKTKLFITFLFLVVAFQSFSQEAKFEAIFLYNFTRQLGWPEEYKTGDIQIMVLGSSEIIDQINTFAKDKPISGQNVVAKSTTIDKIENCHILYIPEDKNEQLQEVITKIGDKSVLIVTEKSNQTVNGAGISFTVEKDSEGGEVLRYQYNVDNIKKQNIKVSSDFKSLGIAM